MTIVDNREAAMRAATVTLSNLIETYRRKCPKMAFPEGVAFMLDGYDDPQGFRDGTTDTVAQATGLDYESLARLELALVPFVTVSND